MPASILDGRALAAELRAELSVRTRSLAARGIAPRLEIVFAGADASSDAYARALERLGAQTGVTVERVLLPEGSDANALRTALERCGADRNVHGVIVAQPLPKSISLDTIAAAIPPEKDVDCTHPLNVAALSTARGPHFIPATPNAVMLLLERSSKWPVRGREVVVVGRSRVVGLPVALLLLARDATVTIAHSKTVDLRSASLRAEILVVAAGVPHLVDGSFVRPGATVVDVGTNVIDGKLVGDVDSASASEVAGEITPVPGGVGPVTNVALLRNVVAAAEA